LYTDNGGTFTPVGNFFERDRVVSVQATFVRPRFRTYSFASIGGDVESLSYATTPSDLLQQLNSFYNVTHTVPGIVAALGWSNAQRPELAISPEDGLSVSGSAHQRWDHGTSGASTRSFVGTTCLYKSLDLPGFAHHVLALRAAGGITDEHSLDRFSAGGISGASLEVFPGFALGEQRREFGVRGYPVSAEGGIRAYSAAVEYRAPLSAPARGFRFIPIFFDKTSLSLFGETGRAYCPARAVAADTGVCFPGDASNPVMTSIGGELNIDSSLELDTPVRLRFGVAFPLANRERLGARRASVYGTFGASF
ncbi:MAG: hypothetical protein ACREMY_09780, partial [bacterium]